jgi:GNAT superfamily N-acetyltransferase
MITIRAGQVKDIEAIVETQVKMAYETEGLALERDTVIKGVQAIFGNPNKGQYYVAEEDGRLVGVLLTIPEWSEWRNGCVLWIHSLYVLKEFRRKGIFKKLYQFLREKVENSSELAGLRLYVDKTNVNAQKVYEKLGMNRDHYLMYEWFK